MAETKLCNVCLKSYELNDMAKDNGKPRTFCRYCKPHLSRFYTIRAAIRRALKTYTNMSDLEIYKILEKEKEKFINHMREQD